jgi:predicted GIY-YIG superfamily endonuclease
VFFVYIARCSDNSLYVGQTKNLEVREKMHDSGTASSYTACRRPVQIVYSESVPDLLSAVTRERQLKRWSGLKKEALITGDLLRLKLLSRRRRPKIPR